MLVANLGRTAVHAESQVTKIHDHMTFESYLTHTRLTHTILRHAVHNAREERDKMTNGAR